MKLSEYLATSGETFDQYAARKKRENKGKKTLGDYIATSRLDYSSLYDEVNKMNDTLNPIYSGWADATTMGKVKNDLSAFVNRLDSAKKFFSAYGSNDEYTKAITDTYNSYSDILNGFGDLQNYYSQFSSSDAYNYSVEMNKEGSEGVESRKKWYESICKEIDALNDEIPWYANSFYGNAFLTGDDIKTKKSRLEELTSFKNQYERGLKVTDDYYQPQTPEFEANAAFRDYVNPTREELWNYDTSRSELDYNINQGYYSYDLDNNQWIDSGGNAINEPTEPTITDKLGLYLSLSEDEIGEGIALATGNKSGFSNTWANLVNEGYTKYWDQLDENEIDIYYDLLKREGQESAYKFLSDMETELGRRNYAKEQERISGTEWYEKLAYNIASVPMNVLGSIPGFIEDTANILQGNEINPYSYAHSASNMSSLIRSDTANIINDATGNASLPWVGTTFGDVYQSIMSSADSLFGGGILGSAGYGLTMGLNSAVAEAQELFESGASTKQIAAGGFFAGAAEMIFETVSLEYFFKNFLESPAKAKTELILKILTQGGVEASEEVATEIANVLSNAAVMKSQSEWQKYIDKYVSEGYGSGEAAWKALKDNIAPEVINAGIGGFISGGVMGSAGSVVNYASYNNYLKNSGQNIIKQGGVSALQKLALETAKEYNTLEGNKGDNKLERLSDKVTAKTTAKNVGLLNEEVDSYRAKNNQKSIENALIEQLVKDGVKLKEAKKQAKRLAKLLNDEYEGAKIDSDDLNEALKKPSIKKVYENVIKNEDSEISLRDEHHAETRAGIIQDYVEGKLENSMSEKFSYSDDGKTINTETGETLSLTSSNTVVSNENGKLILKLSNGDTIDASKISFSSKGEAVLYATIADMGITAETANSLINSAINSDSSDIISVAMGLRDAYWYGANGISFSELENGVFTGKLTEQQRKLAYNLGKADAIYASSKKGSSKKTSSKINSKNDSKYSGEHRIKDGKVTGIKYESLNKTQKSGLDLAKVLSVLGADVYIFETTSEQRKSGKENGSYVSSDGSIHIDLNSGTVNGEGLVAYTISHEFTHFIEDWSSSKFKAYADVLFEELSMDKKSVSNALQYQIEELRNNEKYSSLKDSKLRELAYSELVAKYSEKMFTDTDVLQSIAEKLAKTDKTLLQKIIDFFKDIIDRLREAYEGQKANSFLGDEAIETIKRVDKIRDAFADAAVDALQNYRSVKAENKVDSNFKETASKPTAVESTTETTTATETQKTISDKTYHDFTAKEFESLPQPMRQHFIAKNKAPNAIVFAQMGDFYEAFFSDAQAAADTIGLTLTSREVKGYSDKAKMVGFPVRFFDEYSTKLKAKGFDVVKADSDGRKVVYMAENASTTVDTAKNTTEKKPANSTLYSVRENFVEDKYYKKNIDRFDSLKEGSYITVGIISDNSPLNRIGMPSGKVYFDVSKILNEMMHREDVIPAEKMKKIPAVLNNPIVITEYIDKQGTHSANVYGNLFIGSSPVVVGVTVTHTQKGIVISKIQTVHPKRNYLNDMTDDKILYLSENKKETKLWFQSLGTQKLPLGGNRFGFIRSISQNDSFVKRSDREDISNRTLLANALESVAQNDIEKSKLKEYKTKIGLMETDEQRLSDIKAKIKELSFAKGVRDTDKITELRSSAKEIENRINRYDKQLFKLEASEPLKKVLEREYSKVKKSEAKRYDDALASYKKSSAKAVRNIIQKNQESRKKAIERRNKTEIRSKIKKVVSELNSYLKDNKVLIEMQKVVAEALDAVNMDTVGADERIAKYDALIAKETDPTIIDELTKTRDRIAMQGENMKSKLEKLKSAYAKIINSDDPLIQNSHDPVIENKLEAVIQDIGDVSIKDMSLKQLEEVYDMYKMVLTSVKNANKVFKLGKTETVTQLGDSVMKQVKEVGGSHYKEIAKLKTLKKFAWKSLKPIYAMRMIGADTLTELYKNIRKGEDIWYVDVEAAKAFKHKMWEKYNASKWDWKKEHKFTAKSNKTFFLTINQIMTVYAYSKRQQAFDHLAKGGFVFDSSIEIVQKKHGVPVKYFVNTATAFNLSDKIIAEITSSLSNEQKAFVDEMQKYLSEVMADKGNEVSLALYGIKLFNEESYFPIKSAKQFMYQSNEVSADAKIKNSGFSKPTVPHANNPIILNNFMDIWAGHVDDMSKYHALTLPLEDFNKVFNYKTKTDDMIETMSVRQTLQNAYGSEVNDYIKTLLRDLNGEIRQSGAEEIGKLMSIAKKGAVLASASVTIQQPSAICRAMAYISPKYFLLTAGKQFNFAKHRETWEECKKYAPIAGIKEMGYFDTGLGQSTIDWINSEEYEGFFNKLAAFFKDGNYRDEILSKAPSLADEITWCHIWNAVKKEVASTTDLDTDSEEYMQKCGDRFTDIITLTQVYDSVFSRSELMRSKDTGMKMATAFMAENTTTMNMFVDSIVSAKRTGHLGQGAKILTKVNGAILGSIILNTLLKSIVVAWRHLADDDDETYAEKYIDAFLEDLLNGINPLTYIPIAKDIVSICQGWSVTRMDMDLFEDLINSLKAISSSKKSTYQKVADIIGAISQFFGIPVKNVEREIRPIVKKIIETFN